MANFIHGLNVMACIVAALFFLRFWRQTADRLFVGLTAAFLLLALHWTVLAGIEPQSELRPLVYILRLVAFVVIIAAVLDKNLKKDPPATPGPPSSPKRKTPLV